MSASLQILCSTSLNCFWPLLKGRERKNIVPVFCSMPSMARDPSLTRGAGDALWDEAKGCDGIWSPQRPLTGLGG